MSIEVSDEFIEENQLSQTRPNSRNGGPYSRPNREKRRNEVARLHLELGFSARRISELMQVNRGTINSDLKLIYANLKKTFEAYDTEALLQKQIQRIEDQRTRLLTLLEKTDSFDERLSLERLVADNDSKLASMYLKITDTVKLIHDQALKTLNEWLKDFKVEKRAVSYGDLLKLSLGKYEQVKKIIEA